MSRLLAGMLLTFIAIALAASEPLIFDDPELEARFNELTEELRCLVCQNQSLADSDAPLAHDLRSEVHAMLHAGRNDEEIKRFLVERYGDFVLYRPPVKGNTLVLWIAPAVLLIGGALLLALSIRRRNALLSADRAEGEGEEHC